MLDIFDRVERFIKSNNLISENDVIGCALSGGADSIFMTFVLKKLSMKMNFKVIGIHVNHLLRGKDSYSDEYFSREFCERFDIEFKSYEVDVKSYSSINKLSIETGGREVRYNIFENLRESGYIDKCATGHHANDDVETIIMRIFKGTGVKGIEGIKEIRDGFYIRPILFLKRDEIEEILHKNNIDFKIDKTNFSNDYLRNRIRNVLIPIINESFSMDVTKSILTLKEISKCDNDFFDRLVDEYIKKYVKISNESVCIDKECLKLHQAILFRIIRESIILFNDNINGITFNHMRCILDLSFKKKGKSIQIKKDLYCINLESEIKFVNFLEINKNKKYFKKEILNCDEILNLKKNNKSKIIKSINFLGNEIRIEITNEMDFKISDNEGYKYFSLDNVNTNICIRNRVEGDRFKPFGMNNYKKLKDVLINKKISNRDSIPIITFDDEIVWVFGVRNSDEHKVNESSKTIIKIKLEYL